MKALLLAAGKGKRLRPLTENLPKPMIPIAGKPILEHSINFLARWGIREIAINLHHCPEVVMDHFGDGSRYGVSITYSYEPRLLGTAGAVKKLEHFFEGTFLVLYGDNLIDCNLNRLLLFHHEHQGIGTIVLHYREDVSQSGAVALDADERVTHFIEKPRGDHAISHWVNAGVLVFETEVLKYIPSGIPSDFGKKILPKLLEQSEKLYGYRLKEGEEIWWIDRLEDLDLVQSTFKQMPSKRIKGKVH
jgi:NDP-sugar pyrophosphorylase family protein